ncbi:hypothetical protein KXD40_007174 [Peronospora effusa]|nr:hypothetical protein KXD40_007174 [Peronospora effusa]
MSAYLQEMMDQTISVITNDGRNIIGVLKGFDQCVNVVLDESFERVFSLKEPVEAVELGLYIIRGDNIRPYKFNWKIIAIRGSGSSVIGGVPDNIREQVIDDQTRAAPMIVVRPFVRSASTVYVRPNWLEKNCGDVPMYPKAQDPKASEMLRGGHALQVASATMLHAKELQEIENKAVQRIEEAVWTKAFRFRPSLVLPAVELSSLIVGSVLGVLGDKISTSYLLGVKMAVSDYYNDQIREIYATKPEMVELKELFKVARDKEQEYVDAHTPGILNPNDGNSDPVATFAKASLKVLVQAAKFV